MDANGLCLCCFAALGAADSACPSCAWSPEQPSKPLFPGQLPLGTVLRHRYRIGPPLGRGGFSIAYLTWDSKLCRRRAIKEYFPSGLATREQSETQVTIPAEHTIPYAEGIERYLGEARLLARLEGHPAVVCPLDFFEENATAYLVLEHLEGETLHSYVARHGGKIPYDHALYYMLPLLRALRAVHGAGVLHRDVSPDNVFLTVRGETKLLDFGAARLRSARPGAAAPIIVRDRFAPPEQYCPRSEQGSWTDIYGFAATFYYAITGYAPPPALDRLQHDALRRPRARGVRLPRSAETALLHALSPSADQRPNAETLLQALSPPSHRATPTARQHSHARRAATRALIALCTAAFLVLPGPNAHDMALASSELGRTVHSGSSWLFGRPPAPAHETTEMRLPHYHSTAQPRRTSNPRTDP